MDEDWVWEEVGATELGDRRRLRRFVEVVRALAAQPEASVPQACGDWASTKAAYRFFANAAVSAAALRGGHAKATQARCRAQPVVLALQDTTELDFSHHPHTQGLGHLSAAWHQGLRVHTVFAVSAEGVPLGVLDQQVWARAPASRGVRHQRHTRPLAAKESQRWLTGVAAVQAALAGVACVVTVADREADLYALLARARAPGQELLLRLRHDRALVGERARLRAVLASSPVAGVLTLELGRQPQRSPRQAELAVRYRSVTLAPPRRMPKAPAVTLQVIAADELAPPPGEAGVHWVLASTLPVADFAAAVRLLHWYSLRWMIERYHYVLKSGCRIEQLQLERAERLERALAVYSVVAWRLLWLTYDARHDAEQPADAALAPAEWQALWWHVHHTPPPLDQPPPSLAQCLRWIAALGGYLGRRRDGPPGVNALWRGWQRLQDLTLMLQTLQPHLIHHNVGKG